MKRKPVADFLWLGCLILLMSLFPACHEIQIDKGPFPIEFNHEKITDKEVFLKSIPEASATDSLPNIILILADDLGKYDISTYDPHGVPTPVLDGLAQKGIRFSRAYSTSSVCSPSRASLLTGRYQHRFGFERQPMNRYPRGKFEYWIFDRLIDTDPMQLLNPMSRPDKEEMEKQGIPPGEILLSEILQRRGYRTGIFGKWHLGNQDPFLPHTRGFDHHFGFYEAFTRYAYKSDRNIIDYRHDYFANKHIWRQKRKGSCAIRENHKVVDDKEYLTFSIAQQACSFIDQNRESPFFLYIPFSAPHTPFQVPRAYYDRFTHIEDKNKRVYFGMISALDDAVKMVIDKLETLGLTDQTLIIFASDNGGATYTGATDNGILKAGKFSQFEGGINIPMIMSWEGVLPEGITYPHTVSLLDIFATAKEIAGCDLPSDRTWDGINLIPFLQGEIPDQPHPHLFWRTDFNRAMIQGDWKFIWNERDDQAFLYHLTNDPSEETNQAARYPQIIDTLKHRFREWEEEMMDPCWPGVMQFKFDINGETTWWAI